MNGNTSGTRPVRDLRALSEHLQEVRSYHADFVRQVAKDRPGPLLFHYTNLNGLKGIITEHGLWLTHALYCNDEAELKLGIQVARDLILTLLNEPGATDSKRVYLDALDSLLKEPPREGVYICCFCQEGDVLSQWRAYGGNGNGVSISD